MSFFIDKESSANSESSVGFFLDKCPVGESSSAGDSFAKSSKSQRKRKSRDDEPPPDNSQTNFLFKSSLDESVLGTDADTAEQTAADAKPKNKRPRFSRQVMNARFYDANTEEGFKFSSGKFLPGEISSELREALGLSPRELPLHIYRMRVYGYPPGWLLEAKESSSGISIYDTKPTTEATGASLEESDRYDVSKLVKFAGFNCPLPRKVHDDHRRLGFPPMQINHHLSHYVAYLNQNGMIHAEDAYHTRKLREKCLLERQSSLQNLQDTDDMDIEAESDDSSDNLDASKNLDELEEERNRLLNALNEGTMEVIESYNGDSDSVDNSANISDQSSSRGQSDSEPSVKVPKLTPPVDSSSNSSHLDNEQSSILSSEVCTPVLAYSRPLPDRSKFSHNICDYKPYENLPDAVGSFQKVQDVLVKIRNSLPRIL